MNDFFGLIDKASGNEERKWLRESPLNLLLLELVIAELAARKGGKRKTFDTNIIETNLMENLLRLADAIYLKEYHPSRGTAHIINDPVKREIFAAPYIDRVVHHWIVMQILDWWEEHFIYDSYSCRVGKGTSFGIKRLQHHMAVVSENFKKPVCVVKMDISGYFMHIKRDLLFQRIEWGLDKQFRKDQGFGLTDEELPKSIDISKYEPDPETGLYLPREMVAKKKKRYDILKNTISEVVFDDPVRDVKVQGSYEDWRGLPEDKSLFMQPEGRGMVIGNLTSQEFSNILLDLLDRFVVFTLGYSHYGRYVDDFYIVVRPEELPKVHRDIKAIERFLEGLGLTLNRKKTKVFMPGQGVPFLGMVVKENAIYPGERITRNFAKATFELMNGGGSVESVQSYIGMLQHYDAGGLIRKVFFRAGW